jgi:hypothetical protein
MAKRTIGKPRFYADLGSYLKLKSFYESETYGLFGDNTENTDLVWNLDPIGLQTFEIHPSTPRFKFWFKFLDEGQNNIEVKKLLLDTVPESTSTGLYAGILGHNTKNLLDNNIENIEKVNLIFGREDGIEFSQEDTTEIINYKLGVPEYNGYSLWEIDSFYSYDIYQNINKFGMSFETSNPIGEEEGEYKNIDIGAITFGRWFEPEHSLDLQATIMKDADGIKRNRTVGGNTLINVNYLGSESWGDLPAWTLGKQVGVDYKPVSHTGRRTWRVSLSYIQDENMFNKHNNENQFFTYDIDTNLHTFDTSLGSFFGLTFDGQIPFLFCPDKDADNLEFAKCVITNKPTFKQVANNLFSTSLVLTEVF